MLNQSNQKEIALLTKKVERYMKENSALLERHGLVAQLIVNFPRRLKIPFLSRLCLWIIAKQGGQTDIQFGELRKK